MPAFRTGVLTGRSIMDWNVSRADIVARSRVVASISEVNANGDPFIGTASLIVHGVAPYNGGVWIKVEVKWERDLPFRITLMYENP
jgi:hypothetical protein